MILAVYPRGDLEGKIKGQKIFSSCTAYFREPNFSFRNKGSIGFAPIEILFKDKSLAKLVKEWSGFDVQSCPQLEARIYKNVTLKDIDVKPFLETANTCLVELTQKDQLQIGISYYFNEQDPTSFKTLKVQEALSLFDWITKNPMSQFEEDYQTKFMYEAFKECKGQVRLIQTLQTINGGLVLVEKSSNLGRMKKRDLRVIDEFETIPVNEPEIRIESSLLKIPALGASHSSYTTDSGIVLKYCGQLISSNEEFPYGYESKQIEFLNQLERDMQIALCEGKSDGFGAVRVKRMTGLTPVRTASIQDLNQLYSKIKNTYERAIKERGNRIVGVGIYDTENKVAHVKLDSDFEERSAEGIFYEIEERNPFSRQDSEE